MSLLTKEGRISVKSFARVRALRGLPKIKRAPASVSNVSSFEQSGGARAEGCLVTRTVKHTHQLVRWVNSAHKSVDPRHIEEVLCRDLEIIPFEGFTLNDSSNVAYLEAFVHTSLDVYAFIAVTASLSTLDDLIKMVKSDNDRRQKMSDETGGIPFRSLDFSFPSFVNPEYELVALHPEHFLPHGTLLTVYDSGAGTHKHYVAASDRRLRESSDPNSPPLPPFRNNRHVSVAMNIFLVILNAEIKFRRYFEMIKRNPPPMPLPDDVINVMRRTVDLVDRIYWNPVPTKGSRGEALMLKYQHFGRQDEGIVAGPSNFVQREEIDMEKDIVTLPGAWTAERRRKARAWFASADLEARKAYGTALMSGYDYDFEDVFPLHDAHMYSDTATLEAWTQGVHAEGSNLLA